MKRESTTVVIAEYGSLDDLTKSTIPPVLCLVFRERVNECFGDVFRDQRKGSVYSGRKNEIKSTRSPIVSILYLLYTTG